MIGPGVCRRDPEPIAFSPKLLAAASSVGAESFGAHADTRRGTYRHVPSGFIRWRTLASPRSPVQSREPCSMQICRIFLKNFRHVTDKFVSDCDRSTRRAWALPRRSINQARVMIANSTNHAFGLISLRGMAWVHSGVRHAALTLLAAPELDGRAGGRGRVGLEMRPGSGRVHLPSAHAGVVRSWVLGSWAGSQLT